jgi:hypothetical protein
LGRRRAANDQVVCCHFRPGGAQRLAASTMPNFWHSLRPPVVDQTDEPHGHKRCDKRWRPKPQIQFECMPPWRPAGSEIGAVQSAHSIRLVTSAARGRRGDTCIRCVQAGAPAGRSAASGTLADGERDVTPTSNGAWAPRLSRFEHLQLSMHFCSRPAIWQQAWLRYFRLQHRPFSTGHQASKPWWWAGLEATGF